MCAYLEWCTITRSMQRIFGERSEMLLAHDIYIVGKKEEDRETEQFTIKMYWCEIYVAVY